jgi:hypothetical protein
MAPTAFTDDQWNDEHATTRTPAAALRGGGSASDAGRHSPGTSAHRGTTCYNRPMEPTTPTDPQNCPTGTVITVRALKPLRVGRNGRAAVRKGHVTTAVALKPLHIGYSNVRTWEITATVPGMGNAYGAIGFDIVEVAP